MRPSSDEEDGNSLVPLGQFGSASETEIVLGLLQSSGIPAVHGAQYKTNTPNQILVPAKRVADAIQLIADARGVPSSTERSGDEPRPIVAAIKLLTCGALMLIGLWVLWLFEH
jgi:hypothetical protein